MSAIDLRTLHLDAGAHTPEEGRVCAVEAASLLAGGPLSDHPTSVCPVIAAFTIRANDELGDAARQRLVEIVPLLVGTRSTPAVEHRRGYLCADRAVRVFAPAALRDAGMIEQAEQLERIAPVTDADAARAAAWAAEAAWAADAARAAAGAAPAHEQMATWAVALIRDMCALTEGQQP